MLECSWTYVLQSEHLSEDSGVYPLQACHIGHRDGASHVLLNTIWRSLDAGHSKPEASLLKLAEFWGHMVLFPPVTGGCT